MTAAHRSDESSAVRPAVAAAPSLRASSGGNITPALGGCDERRSARIERPTVSAASTSSSQSFSSCSCFLTRSALSLAASSRVDSSRATIGSSLAATTLRRSRRSRCSICRWVASARSSQSATRSFGIRSSAIFSTLCSGIVGLPSAASCLLSSARRDRTAAMPWSASSAIGRCSSGISARTSLRRALPGRRRLGFGRCGTSGGGSKWGRRGPDARPGRRSRHLAHRRDGVHRHVRPGRHARLDRPGDPACRHGHHGCHGRPDRCDRAWRASR